MSEQEYPEILAGLEYETVGSEGCLCSTCGGVVAEGGRMVRLSSRRKVLVYREKFPASTGVCLSCAREILGGIAGAQMSYAENYLRTLDKSELRKESSDGIDRSMLDVIEATVGGIKSFIERVSEFVSAAASVEIQWVCAPTPPAEPDPETVGADS